MNTNLISKRVAAIKPSPTLVIDAKAKTLKQQGVDILNFAPGEPDFDTPSNIKNAGIHAIINGYTKYCPVGGTPELKDAVIKKFERDNNLQYAQNEILVSCGAKHSIYNLLQTIIDDGDEVIIPAPFWVSYPDMVIIAGGKPIIVSADDKSGFKVNAKQIKEAVTEKTKAIIINSPSNPTGAAYTAAELQEIADICLEKDILIIADDIYEKLVYDGFKFTSVASLSPKIKEKTIVINGLSKAYSMTGWRIGFAAGNKEIIAGMSKVQSQSTSNPTSISLKAAVEALNGPQDSVEMMRVEFEKRRNYILERLLAIKGISCQKPQGAFYVFPNIKEFLGKTIKGKKINTDMDFADLMLEEAKIAIVPGSPFGADGYVRFSYATSMDNIKEGLDRFERTIKD